jgi:hypothetical protein
MTNLEPSHDYWSTIESEAYTTEPRLRPSPGGVQ